MSSVKDLVNVILSHRWSWNITGVDSLILAFSCVPHSETDGRRTYEMPEGATLSVYFEGQQVEFVEITLESVSNLDVLSPDEYDGMRTRFLERYVDVVADAEEILGRPVINVGPDDLNFPSDQDAERLALWNHPCGRIMVELKHEDREVPMRLSIVLAPVEV